jgi:predicted 2-oxoglutarate/Fe(II)-dependent dioxygenase YbiX
MLPKIIVRPNFFPAWWCDNINNHMTNNVPLSGFGKKGVRRCDVRLLTPNMKPYQGVFNSIMDFAKANIENLGIDIDYKIDGPIQHITYKTGHHVGWHDDTMNYNMALNNPLYSDLKTDRKVSLTVMLSDPTDYTGGNFVFEKGYPLNTKVEGKGTVAMFTSYTPHMVTEITSGVRNILFVFITGPTWR